MKKKKKIIKGLLTSKLVVTLLLMAILIHTGILIIGRNEYDQSIKEYYDMMAYDAADVAKHFFKEGELSRYSKYAYGYNHGEYNDEDIKNLTKEMRYKEVSTALYHLRNSFDANDVFVVTLDVDVMEHYTDEAYDSKKWKPLYYIFDCYADKELYYKFGEKGAVLPEFRNEVLISYMSGTRNKGFYISKSPFGFNMTALYPVVENGESVAFIGVEIPMKDLKENKDQFSYQISIGSSLIVLIVLLIHALALHRMLIVPIELISKEANDFVDNNTRISTKLETVRTRDEIQNLSESLLQMEIDINEYIEDIQKITAEKERIGAELNVATQIQSDMLPKVFPAFPGRTEFDIYATMVPAKEVGGDFYDYFLIGQNKLGLIMADVSGKGVPAALFMVIAKTLLKNRALMGGSPSDVLYHVNNELLEGNEAGLFVTVWFAIVDLETGKGVAANAGHEHPCLKRKDGKFEMIKYRHSPAVSTFEDLKYNEHEFELHPGDTLFVYTDGVTEATNKDNVLFGEDRLIEALNKEPDAEPQKLLANVTEDINDFVQDAPQFDDITMMGFVYEGTKSDTNN